MLLLVLIFVLHLQAVCEETLRREPQAGLHLDAVVFGGEDFRASIGISFLKEYVNSVVVMILCSIQFYHKPT